MLHQSRWPNMQLNSADTSIRKPGLGMGRGKRRTQLDFLECSFPCAPVPWLA
ncbi:hypothetical protein LEMLEM_LOCUS27508 [Lemmus lemmus]